MTLEELRVKLSDETANDLDITEVREAVAEADEVISGLETRVRDLEVDLDTTKDALDKARIQNAKYYNSIKVKDDELTDLDKEKYYATEDELKEVFD